MWMLDRIYLYSFAYLNSLKGNRARQNAAYWVGYILLFHILAAFFIVSDLLSRNLLALLTKPGLVIATLLLFAAPFYVYQVQDRASDIISEHEETIGEKRTATRGLMLMIWSFCVPLLSIACIIVHHRLHA